VELSLPAGLLGLIEALRAAGGRPYLVGGFVRDALLGIPLGDFDVEVYGLATADLERALGGFRVDLVGQAFAVYKVSGLQGITGAVDVSLPRRDSKVGEGHRGIAARGDPGLDVAEAARRRDFTINAMLLDPATGEVLDPHGGRRDLEARLLRAVDPLSFGEDPLRALRAVQLAARFELRVEEGTASLCASMPLAELPAERVFGEIEKLLLKARRPSIGLELMRGWEMLPVVAPELVPLPDTQQEPDWHPEGDVWVHTLQAVDVAAGFLEGLDRPRALTVMLGTLCHDLGKPATTRFEDGRLRSKGHDEAGLAPTAALLDRWNVHTREGYDVRAQVLALVLQHLKPYQLYDDRERVTDGAIRRLAAKCEPLLLHRVASADCLGRLPRASGSGSARSGHLPVRDPDAPPARFSTEPMDWFLARARQLDVAERPPAPMLLGRHVLALGVAPGPEVGRILRAVYERQLDGAVRSLEEATQEARRLLAVTGPGSASRSGSR
jgi:tRNA nucleotidyltransferase (CCA-adding enzyme)